MRGDAARVSRRVGILAGIALSVFAGSAQANSTGITFRSGKQGATCSSCHAGGVAPTVRFEGPTTLVSGEIGSFRFVVDSQAPTTQTVAGFNVAASDGTLTPGTGEKLNGGEITH